MKCRADFDEDDLEFMTESNEDDTEIALVIRSRSGKKITQHEFVMQVEQYLHSGAEAEIMFRDSKANLH